MDWHAFEVDGETFYWTAYPSKTGTADGAWVDDENLSISRAPNTQGIGRNYPADTIIRGRHRHGEALQGARARPAVGRSAHPQDRPRSARSQRR